MTFTAEVRPGQTTGGTGDVSITGGDQCLSDDSDATYVETASLEVAGSFAIIQFPGVVLPAGALADFYIRGRYEQITGIQEGRPRLGLRPTPWSLQMHTTEYASAGEGIVVSDGPWAYGGATPSYGNREDIFPRDFITPTSWDLTYDFNSPDFTGGPCAFRVYEITWVIQYILPGTMPPPRRIYPRRLEIRSVYPPPNTQQYGRRTGSSSTL